jgi:hypothetical protein
LRSTFQVSNSTGFYPRIQVDTTNSGAVGQAGGVLLTETIAAAGLGPAMSAALAGWRKPLAVHDPAKVVLDLAVTLALGGDALADMALLRGEPGLYGAVASDATVSRTITALAGDAPAVLAAIDTARAAGRARAWKLAGVHAPNHGASASAPVIVDLDATLVGSHSEKEQAAPTYKKGFGFHPLWSFVDHGPAGTGEPLSVLLRPGNAGSNTATDHIAVIKDALAQLPGHRRGKRAGRAVLIRPDSAGCTHKVLTWMTGQRLSYSVGFPLPHNTSDLLELIPADVWTPACDAHDQIRDGAWVAELTALLDMTGWPAGMRVIVRNDPTPARSCGSPTSTDTGSPRSRPTPRPAAPPPSYPTWSCATAAEPAVRTGSGSPRTPAWWTCRQGFAQNRIWCAIVALAVEITAWMQMLALNGHQARRWEPKRLRLRLFTLPATIARTGRQVRLHLATKAPWANLVNEGIRQLRALAVPG